MFARSPPNWTLDIGVRTYTFSYPSGSQSSGAASLLSSLGSCRVIAGDLSDLKNTAGWSDLASRLYDGGTQVIVCGALACTAGVVSLVLLFLAMTANRSE